MGSNPWLAHLKSVWAKTKKQGKSYRETMIIAKRSYTKKGKGKASKGAEEEVPKKKKRRRRKKKAQ